MTNNERENEEKGKEKVEASEQKENNSNNVRKVRIIYSDPYATESSSDEEFQVTKTTRIKRVIKEVFIPKFETVNQFHEKDENQKTVSTTNYNGFRLRKWKRYPSQIHNPFKKKRKWLKSSFDLKNTEEDESVASRMVDYENDLNCKEQEKGCGDGNNFDDSSDDDDDNDDASSHHNIMDFQVC